MMPEYAGSNMKVNVEKRTLGVAEDISLPGLKRNSYLPEGECHLGCEQVDLQC